MGNRYSQWVAAQQLSPEVKRTMYQEYGPMLYIGGVFLHLKPRAAPFSILQSITFFSLVLAYAFFLVKTMPETPTMVSFSQLLNYLSLALIHIGVYYGAMTNRDCIIRLLEIMSVDFYDYGDTFDLQEIDKWKKSLRRFKIIILVCIPSYLSVVVLTTMFREYIDLIFGYAPKEQDYDGAVYQKTPIPLWFPFKITNNFQWLLVTLSQMLAAAIVGVTICTADVMMLFLGQTVALQMRILSQAAFKLDERARNIYAKMYGGRQPPTDPIEKVKDKQLGICYRQAIKQIVEHHLVIQEKCRFYANYNQLGKWPTFLAVMNGSILIAMSITVVILGSGDLPSTLIAAGELLIAEVLSMWLLCESGQLVSNWSEQLNEAMYSFDWPDISTSNKKLIMIFQENAKRPLVMMAGGLTPINRDTFGTIMNSAYTYVNLLRARI